MQACRHTYTNTHPQTVTHHGVVGVGLVAIKKVFAVEHGFPPCCHDRCDRVCYHRQVLFQRYLERRLHLKVPGLAKDTHSSRVRPEARTP